MATIKYKEDSEGNKQIILKEDSEGNKTVSCGCCACGGCGSIADNLPATGTPPVKPTSLAWSTDFNDIEISTPCDAANTSGVIDDLSSCSSSLGYAFQCWTCEEVYGEEGEVIDHNCYGYYGIVANVTLLFGKYKVETGSVDISPCGTFPTTALVTDISPEAECAYWLVMNVSSSAGAFGWSHFNANPLRITPNQLMGTHTVSCENYFGQIGYGFDEETGETTIICESSSSITRTATITIS